MKNDAARVGSVINVTATAKAGGNYYGSVSGTYKITKKVIGSTKASIGAQIYTGKSIIVDATDITVKDGKKKLLAGIDYEIVEGSFKNNINKGTASVTIRGLGNYGGVKTVTFTIKAKGFSWWWR